MARLKVYKRNSKFIDPADLVEDISSGGLVEGLKKYYNLPLEKEAKKYSCRTQFSAVLK
ncbi:MAG TPA: hypothetical protein VFP25_01675 [Nitrososphaeraceae archaeon]|nr:hypothetical protein [Nitrososphaeraceae archaeon]